MWSDGGELVCIASDEAFYILKYDSQAVQQAVNTNEGIDDDGVEAAFDVRERERERGGQYSTYSILYAYSIIYIIINSFL